jgi:hypothetical protein
MACDHCGIQTDALWIFPIKFEGEPRIGGGYLSWDGRKGMMDKRGRHKLELCRRCAEGLVEAAQAFLDKTDSE